MLVSFRGRLDWVHGQLGGSRRKLTSGLQVDPGRFSVVRRKGLQCGAKSAPRGMRMSLDSWQDRPISRSPCASAAECLSEFELDPVWVKSLVSWE